MTGSQAVIVYFVTWWLLLFMALPIGVKPQERLLPGAERAAPGKSYLRIKALCVTVLALIVTWVIYKLIQSGLIAVK